MNISFRALGVLVGVALLVGMAGIATGVPTIAQADTISSESSSYDPTNEMMSVTIGTIASNSDTLPTANSVSSDATALSTQDSSINIAVNDSTNGDDSASVPITISEKTSTQIQVENTEVSIDGSTVTVNNSAGVQSFAITGIPSNVGVSNTEPGVYDDSAGEILVGGPASPAPESYQFTIDPDASTYSFGETVNITVDSQPVSFTVVGPTIASSEVDIDGSTIEIDNSVGATSYSITNLPNDIEISNTGDGVYDANAGEILVGGAAGTASDSYQFTLNPDNNAYEVGENVNFTVAGVETSVEVTQTTVPASFGEEYRDVSPESYSAVVDGEDALGAGNLAGAIQSWAGDDGSAQGSIGGTNVGAGELSAMINYWSQEVAG